MTRPKIIVTGGAGYIGSHVTVALHAAGYQPVIIDNFSNSSPQAVDGIKKITGQPLEVYPGNCADQPFLQHVFDNEQPILGVIHFAAYKAVAESVAQPLDYYDNNLNTLITLLKVMTASQCPLLVFSSSATVYGQAQHLPVTEQSPCQPAQSPYGNTKQIGEEIIRDVVASGAALRSVALRYFNPIGAHPSAAIGELPLGVPNNLVPFVTQTAAGIREQLTVFGNDYDTPDGTCVRDYINVMDLAEAHVATLDYLQKQTPPAHFDVINVGTGQGHSVLEVLKLFEESNGVRLNTRIGARRAGDVPSLYANVDKAARLLGWQATRTLRQSLQTAWAWQQTL